MRTYLRDGEMNILADHHLPLLTNDDLGRSGGEWDLRVSVDSTWLGMLSFSVSPSVFQRERELEERLVDRSSSTETPLSFEDLMRGQERRKS